MTRIALLTTAIVTGLVVATGADAFGGRGAADARPDFATLDTDGDGRVTAAEMQAYPAARMAERFKAADTDGDGKIGKDELAAAVDTQRAGRQALQVDRMMTRMDTNQDGAISQEEMAEVAGRNRAADPGARFIARFDTDNDGAISAAEYVEAGKFMQMNGPRGDRGRMDRGQRPRGQGPRGDAAPFWRN